LNVCKNKSHQDKLYVRLISINQYMWTFIDLFITVNVVVWLHLNYNSLCFVRLIIWINGYYIADGKYWHSNKLGVQKRHEKEKRLVQSRVQQKLDRWRFTFMEVLWKRIQAKKFTTSVRVQILSYIHSHRVT